MGQLELNAFLPVIAHHLLDSLKIMNNGVQAFIDLCISGMEVDAKRCEQILARSIGIVSALTPYLGYNRAQEVYVRAREEEKEVKEVLKEMGLLSTEDLEKILNPREMTRPGIAGSKSLDIPGDGAVRHE